MAENCAAPDCDTVLDENPPGVSLEESPFWSLTREATETDREILGTHETLYFCSSSCVMTFIK